jgi:ABC-2 type transport system permease protein
MASGSMTPPLGLIVRQQWTSLLRERRLQILGLLVLALCALTLFDAGRDAGRLERARLHDTQVEQQVWQTQGEANPHGAAHFGRYAYKPHAPLAVIDPGLQRHLGSTVKLEGHLQNTSRFKATDGGAALNRFGGFSPAFALQVLVPLLIVFATFGAFAGERARQMMWQEIGLGATPWQLMLGRATAYGAAVLLLLGTVAVLALLATLPAFSPAHLAALGLMLLGYGLYWLAFLCVTLAISAWAANSRSALFGALGFWMVAAVLVPMVAPALAEARHPTPSATVFEAGVVQEVMKGPDGHSPRDERFAAFKAATLAQYGVKEVDDLPINYNGLLFEHGEKLTSAIYNRHFDRLYDDYAAQVRLTLAASAVSPLMALRPLSALLAQTDMAAHRHFLKQAEAYRYQTVQALNRDIKLNRKPEHTDYASDVSAITAAIRFTPRPRPFDALLPDAWIPFALLLAWVAGGAVLMRLAARRVEGSA